MGKVGKGLGYYSDIGRKTKGMALYSTFPFVLLSLSRARARAQQKSAFCVFLLSLFMLLGWRNSLSRIVHGLCLLSRFFYVAIDCRFLSPHRRYALVLSASFPFDKNMKSRSEGKESRGHARLSFFEYREQEKVK